MKNPKSVNAIPLSELIEALKLDLSESVIKRSADWRPMFKVAEATVEANVVFERNVEAGGKLSVWVAEFSPKAAEKSASTHRVSIKLIPVGDGMTVEVGKQDPLVRGTTARPRKTSR